ncbi:MAG: hypothetical protein RIS64_239 [Bacteroidota bacterium]
MRLNRRNIIQILVQIPCMGCCCVAIATTSHDRTRFLISKTGFITISRTVQFENDTNSVKIATVKKDSTIDKNVVLSELVCTGNTAAMPISIAKSIFPVKTITALQIEQSGAQNLGDAIKNLMNISLQQDAILGAGLMMMGMSGENVKILIDGVPIIGRQNGNIDLTQIALNNVERIERVEGPLSTAYGTNALAGVINIITKKIPTQPFDFQLKTYAEANRHYNIASSIGFKNENQTIQISGGRNFFQGWSPTDMGRFQSWKPKIFYFGDLHYGLKLGKMQIGYSATYADEYMLNRGMPELPYKEQAFDDTYRTIRYGNALIVQQQAKNNYWNVQAAYNFYKRQKNTYLKDLTKITYTPTANDGDQDTTKFDLINVRGSWVTNRVENWSFESGMDVNIENGESRRLKEKDRQISDYAWFSSVEWDGIDGLKIRPSFRYAYNTAYQAPISPSVAIKYAFDEESRYIIRSSWAKGFRSPSLKELYFYFVDVNHNIRGNENLKAETSNSFNLSFFGQIFTKGIPSIIESSLFCNRIENQIALAAISGTEYGYVNIGQLTTLGGNVSGKFTYKGLEIHPGWGLTRSIQYFESKPHAVSAQEGRLGVHYNIPKTECSVHLLYKYAGQQPGYVKSTDGNVYPTAIGSYQMADLTINGKSWNKQWRWTAGIKNIFDVKNIQSQLASGTGGHSGASNSSPVGTGRTFFISSVFELGSQLKKIFFRT